MILIKFKKLCAQLLTVIQAKVYSAWCYSAEYSTSKKINKKSIFDSNMFTWRELSYIISKYAFWIHKYSLYYIHRFS
jgi:hypothetical protein